MATAFTANGLPTSITRLARSRSRFPHPTTAAGSGGMNFATGCASASGPLAVPVACSSLSGTDPSEVTMGATTKIGWAHASQNFWIGCSKASDACRDCYAIPIAADMRPPVEWGADVPRKRTSDENWNNPLRWQRMHDRGQTHMILRGKSEPVPLWIFGNSLSDFFDNHPDVAEWREEARTTVIRPTTLLRWIFLTKRVPNVSKMLPRNWDQGRNY